MTRSIEGEEVNLFAIEGKQKKEKKDILTVVRAEYKASQQCSYEDLFEGFDELYALTYSVGVKQVERVMQYFKYGEVIIGSPSQIHKNLAEMLAKQEYDIGYFSRNKELQKRIENGSFRFYVTTGSHSKLYLLKAYDGRKRVIMGSANFSKQAWDSSQIETYIYFDDTSLFDEYLSLYEALRADSSDEIGKEAREIRVDGNNLEDIPLLSKVVLSNQAILIHDVKDYEEIEYVTQVTAATKRFAELLEKAKVKADKVGRIELLPKKVTYMKQLMKQEYDKKKKELIVNPELRIDYEREKVFFAGTSLDLHPGTDSVKSDIACLLQYMQGTKSFTQNTEKLREIYWKILIYLFASPFIAPLRYYYRTIAPINSVGRIFPMYMLIRGPKNGGKSAIISLVQTLMFGRPLTPLTPEVISPKLFKSYELQVKGCPILIDDIDNNRLKYIKTIVKDEGVLLGAHVLDHGCFIMTTNEAEKVLPEVAKRVIVFQISNQVTDDEATERDISLHKLKKQIGTALYHEYLRRMIPQVKDLISLLKTEEFEDDEWMPDVFSVDSQTLIALFSDMGIERPKELLPFSWKDFMGEGIKSEKAIDILKKAYMITPEIFRVNQKEDVLLIDLKEANFTVKIVDAIKNELPVSAECQMIGFTLQVKWSVIKEYAGIDFRHRDKLLTRFSHWFRGD